MQNSWHLHTLTPKEQTARDALARELGISTSAAALLVRRGIVTAEAARAFINPKLEALHDPFLMKDMQEAVNRLTLALQKGERILIYGDYDVDGTTAVSLVYRFLHKRYQNLDFYIPDRYTEGYGISFQGIDYAYEQHCSLIIALDCGIRSCDKVAYATQKGIDFIICDHHLPGNEIPQAVAVLDPKREDCPYPFKELSGCGVGFKLMQAFAQQHTIDFKELYPLLELTAMSIASDIVSVMGENRILAFYGLRCINQNPSVGVKHLLSAASLPANQITFSNLVYQVGPRINACGRIKSGKDAVRLLITTDDVFAEQMSQEVNKRNQTRKDLDQSITNEALQILQQDPDNEQRFSTVVCGRDWHKGVIGIVASRLTEQYYRPTIVLTETEGMVSGSARSVGGFDIYSAIDACHDLLENFGGHVFAAGLSMKSENYALFKQRFEAYVAAHILPEQQQPSLEIEAEIGFDDITTQFFNVLQHLEPCGPDNPQPSFMTRRVCNYRYSQAVGKNKEHLRLDVTDGKGALAGIAFGKGDWADTIKNGKSIDLCYNLDKNIFRGNVSIQMFVQDIHLSDY